jgi:hypothetical protein
MTIKAESLQESSSDRLAGPSVDLEVPPKTTCSFSSYIELYGFMS